MFVFDPDYTFEWPVKVIYPSAGGDVENTFTGVFRMPQDELEIHELPLDEDGNVRLATMQDFVNDVRARLAKYWVGWKDDLQRPDGAPLPYSDQMRDQLLKIRPIREAVDRAITQGAMGMREKN